MKSLFAVSAFLSVAGFFLPISEKSASLRRQISFAFGAIMLVFILRPFADLPAMIADASASLSQIGVSEEGSAETDFYTLDSTCEEAYCLGVRRAIAERFSLSEEEISVSVSGFSFSDVKAEKIRILLSGAAARSNLSEVRKYVEETFGPCELEIPL